MAALEGAQAVDDASRLELLLRDIRTAFGAQTEMPSADLVNALVELDGRPWAELGRSRKPLTRNRLARMLKPLAIGPEQIKFGKDGGRKGYRLDHFKEAFERYLKPLPEGQPSQSTSEGGVQPKHRNQCDEMGTSEISLTETCPARGLGCEMRETQ